MQTWTAPAGVTSIIAEVYGAQGGDSRSYGGYGGLMITSFSVTPGQTLAIYVGRRGSNPAGGFNGGGNGTNGFFSPGGGGGGGRQI